MESAANILYNEAAKYSLLSSHKLENFIEAAKKGNAEAIEKLSLHTIRLVHSMANKYVKYGIPYEELVDRGIRTIENLPKIIKKYNPEKGKFSTYICMWIKKYIYDGGLESLVNIPRDIKIKIKAFEKAEKKNISEEKLKEISEAKKAMNVFSLDEQIEQIKHEENLYLKEILPDSRAEKEFEIFERNYMLEKWISKLPSQHKKIIELIYLVPRTEEEGIPEKRKRGGQASNTYRTMAEVGRIMNLSRERIRQIREEAIRMLKKVAKGEFIEELVERNLYKKIFGKKFKYNVKEYIKKYLEDLISELPQPHRQVMEEKYMSKQNQIHTTHATHRTLAYNSLSMIAKKFGISYYKLKKIEKEAIVMLRNIAKKKVSEKNSL